jgi:hypothetical protein
MESTRGSWWETAIVYRAAAGDNSLDGKILPAGATVARRDEVDYRKRVGRFETS